MYKKEIKFVNQTLFFYNIDEFKKKKIYLKIDKRNRRKEITTKKKNKEER